MTSPIKLRGLAPAERLAEMDSLQCAFMENIFGMPRGSYLCSDDTELEDFGFQEMPKLLARKLGHASSSDDAWWGAVQWLIQHYYGIWVEDKRALLADVLHQIRQKLLN